MATPAHLSVLAKQSIVKLAVDHKASCAVSDCGVSLLLVRLVAEAAGIEFTEEEARIFT